MFGLEPSQTFALFMTMGVATGLFFMYLAIASEPSLTFSAAIDLSLSAFLGALLGGRLLAMTIEDGVLWAVWYGGLSWAGALIGAVTAPRIFSNKLDYRVWGDAFALVLPFAAISIWISGRYLGYGYGPVAEDLPGFLTGFLPDAQQSIALRLELQLLGVLLNWIIFSVLIGLTLKDWFKGQRLFIAASLIAVTTIVLGFWRGDVNTLLDYII